MKKRILSTLSGLLFISLLGTQLFAQCKSQAKKCLPDLSPFVYSGKLNSVILSEGEFAELTGPLFAGQEYRLLLCAPSYKEGLVLRVLDKNKKMVFDNSEHGNALSWDFKVNSTEDYTIVIGVADSKKTKAVDMNARACITLLVGFKR
jgi:hypothetical protein